MAIGGIDYQSQIEAAATAAAATPAGTRLTDTLSAVWDVVSGLGPVVALLIIVFCIAWSGELGKVLAGTVRCVLSVIKWTFDNVLSSIIRQPMNFALWTAGIIALVYALYVFQFI